MSYSAPKVKEVVQKTPDPLINLGDTSGAITNERKKKGLLSTFTGGGMAGRSSGFLSGLINKQQPTLGNQVTD